LRGVLTALENLITPLVVVTTVDMPGVRMEQLRWVIDQFAKQPRIFGMMCQRLFARALNSPSPGTPGEGRGGGCVERSSDGADPLPNPPPEYRGRENTLAPASVIEPFPSIYRRDALDEIARRLASSRRSVHGLLESASFAAAIAPLEWEPRVWMNLNRPEDLDAYLKSIDAAG